MTVDGLPSCWAHASSRNVSVGATLALHSPWRRDPGPHVVCGAWVDANVFAEGGSIACEDGFVQPGQTHLEHMDW